MSHRVAFLTLTFALAFCTVASQARGQATPPKPDPHVRKLAIVVGKFANEGHLKEGALGPNSPAQEAKGIDDCKWVAGGFGVYCNSTTDIAGLKVAEAAIFYYDPVAKIYHYHSVDSAGGSESSQGTVSNDTWTWNGESVQGGKVLHIRYIMKATSKDSFEYSVEAGDNEAAMRPVMTGKDTRITGAAKPSAARPAAQ